MKLKSALIGAAALTALGTSAALSAEITIATVNNNDMIVMQKLAPQWEKATGNKINWVVLEENVLRQRTTQDISTKGGSFDIMFIGAYETPIWGANGWLVSLDDFGNDPKYDLKDIFQLVRNGLSAKGSLYAVPLYSETSFTYYRTDLLKKAGIEVPKQQITYDQFKEMAAKLHDPKNGIYGTCQRGKAGWGGKHGLRRHDGKCLRCTLVRHGLEAAAHKSRVENCDHILCRSHEELWSSRRDSERPQRKSRSLQGW